MVSHTIESHSFVKGQCIEDGLFCCVAYCNLSLLHVRDGVGPSPHIARYHVHHKPWRKERGRGREREGKREGEGEGEGEGGGGGERGEGRERGRGREGRGTGRERERDGAERGRGRGRERERERENGIWGTMQSYGPIHDTQYTCTCTCTCTRVIMEGILLQFLLVDAPEAILVEEPLQTLHHIQLGLQANREHLKAICGMKCGSKISKHIHVSC